MVCLSVMWVLRLCLLLITFLQKGHTQAVEEEVLRLELAVEEEEEVVLWKPAEQHKPSVTWEAIAYSTRLLWYLLKEREKQATGELAVVTRPPPPPQKKKKKKKKNLTSKLTHIKVSVRLTKL